MKYNINTMSKTISNISDYLLQVQKLTNTNLQILKTLNDSFFTKQNHLYAEVNDTTYVIPSFISLENKINALQENFENLVKSPETCEAYFNFDGNTRSIEVRKYSHVPDSITLPTVNNYKVESNDIFKDFLTPVPYVNLSVPTLPNDIVEVSVKKIIPKTAELKEVFKKKLSYTETTTNDDGSLTVTTLYNRSVNNSYGDIHKTLLNYVEDVDYVEYDTIYPLPIRTNSGTATYVIEKVVSDVINDDLEEIITLKLRNNLTNPLYNNKLTYKLFDETIEKPLKVGDELINFDGTGKVKIVEVRTATNTVVVKVVNGEYLNFIGTDSYDSDNDTDIHDLSKLRYHSVVDFTNDKYVKVPLEEDRYVFVAIAPINSRMNVQGNWGNGLIIDAHSLMNDDETKSFKTYYDANVRNIGDILFEMTSMVTAPVSELTKENFDKISTIKPIINDGALTVLPINTHLSNSITVRNIRDAYNQKIMANEELTDVQTKIDSINEQLASISFDDTTGLRSVYTAQLTQLNSKKNELVATITKTIDTITHNVNSSEIPIENAKYRIRGFVIPKNLGTINDENIADHIIGLKVQYRYKNVSTELGTATSLVGSDGETYIYSDWNNMTTFNKNRIAKYVDGQLIYAYEESNESVNEPSYNQIDIPITQAETVDIRIKYLYDFGQPYITMTSDWSGIVNVSFPSEYTKDVPILTIIEENNNDIETNRFKNIMKEDGVDAHVTDKVVDQDITYYHKPENIASGFYTSERRIIPLKDKLVDITNEIASLKSDILGSESSIRVGASVGDIDVELYSDQLNTITLEPYNKFLQYVDLDENKVTTAVDKNGKTIYNDGNYTYSDGVVTTLVNISLTNNTENVLKLYPIFPGNRNTTINGSVMVEKATKEGYIDSENGVWVKYNGGTTLQTLNQFVTFRVKDVWDGTKYYDVNAPTSTQNQQSSTDIKNVTNADNVAMSVYPCISNQYGLCVASDSNRTWLTINPGEEVLVPIMCEYAVKSANASIEKTISFDLRNSLYKDPINYTVKFIAKNTTTVQDIVSTNNRRKLLNRLFKPIRYYNTVK